MLGGGEEWEHVKGNGEGEVMVGNNGKMKCRKEKEG